MTSIPFSPPDIHEDDIAAVVEVLRSGWITTGPKAAEFESRVAEYSKTPEALALSSCTSAIEFALRVSGVGPHSEVIVPAYTYTATASPAHHLGATIVMVDTAEHSYFPSVEAILQAVTPRTQVIVVVDYAGVPFPTAELIARLDAIAFDREDYPFNLSRPVVLVDGAHSLGAQTDGLPASRTGDFTAFSFHAVKNLTTGEGGMLTWRANLVEDNALLKKELRQLALHGQSKDALAKMKAGAWEYDIAFPGYKENMPDILAALGLSQLDRYPAMIARRREILNQYQAGLHEYLDFLPHSGECFQSSAHLAIAAIRNSNASRDELILHLARNGVSANVHYKPLPLLTAYSNLGFRTRDYPHAMAQYRKQISLPLHTKLTDADVQFVISKVREFFA